MKKIAFILSLLVFSGGFTPAHANEISKYVNFITPITTTQYELPSAESISERKEYEFLIRFSDPVGEVSVINLGLYDASNKEISFDQHMNLTFWREAYSVVESKEFRIYGYESKEIKLPLTLKIQVKFLDSAGKLSLHQSYPMNFIPNQSDIIKAAEESKAKAEAEAKAIADAAAKAAIDAKIVADAKAAGDAAAAFWNKAAEELKAKQEEQLRLALDAAIKKAIVGKPCSKAGQKQVYAGAKFTCVKSGKKLVWKRTY